MRHKHHNGPAGRKNTRSKGDRVPGRDQAHRCIGVVQTGGHAAVRGAHGANGCEVRAAMRREQHAHEKVEIEADGRRRAIRDRSSPHTGTAADACTLKMP